MSKSIQKLVSAEGVLKAFAFGGVFYLFVNAQIAALLSNVVMSGETVSLSNVPIEYARKGAWHYPYHAQAYFYPGFERFVIHPPLHYALSAGWIKAFGVGYWQLHAQSVLGAVIGMGAAGLLTWRFFGFGPGLLVLALPSGMIGFSYSAQIGRPDLTFGLVLAVLSGCLTASMVLKRASYYQYAAVFGAGVFTALSLSTHWYGYFSHPLLVGACVIWLLQSMYDQGGHWPAAWLKQVGVAFLGWVSVMAIWLLSWGSELWRALIVVLIKGNEFKEVLDRPIRNFYAVLTEQEGGHIVLVGLVLASVFFVAFLAKGVRSKFAIVRSEKIFLCLYGCIIAYLFLFLLLAGNIKMQYAGNFFFVGIPLASVGYALTFKVMVETIGRFVNAPPIIPRIGYVACMLATLATAFSSPHFKNYFYANPLLIENPNAVYQSVRRWTAEHVAKDSSVLVGSMAYPYFYDQNYISTMRAFAAHALKDFGDVDARRFFDIYLKDLNTDYRTEPFYVSDRAAQIAEIDYLVLSPSNHSWESLFYNPLVWRESHVETAVFFIVNTNINRKPVYKGAGGAYPFGAVLIRADLAVRAGASRTGTPRFYRVDENLTVFEPGAFDRHAHTSFEEWVALADDAARRDRLYDYFMQSRWFGGNLSEKEKAVIVKKLFSSVNWNVRYAAREFNGVPRTRDLATAVDAALSSRGIPEEFISRGRNH